MTVIRTALYSTPAALRDFPFTDALPEGGVLLLLSLGFSPDDFSETACSAPENVTILLADCYGILGTEAGTGRNREFMEQGRGQEYGGIGGRGGQGVTMVAIAGAGVDGTLSDSPAHLIIAAHGKPRPQGSPCFGGVAKATRCWDRHAGRFVEIPGVRIDLPPDCEPEAVALFPCYMRGINYYGRDDVEPETVARIVPGVPVFGMFCHGELGPSREEWGYELGSQASCSQHSMVTVTAFIASRRRSPVL